MANSTVNSLSSVTLPEIEIEACQSPWWAFSGHLQTIAGALLPSPKLGHPGQKIEIPLSDGDLLVGFLNEGSSDTVVSLFHGLAGDIDSNYMHRATLLCQKLGHSVVRVNHRGAGAGHGLARKSYHSGRGDDVGEVIEALRRRFPGRRQIAIGFSMSGNILLHLLCGLGNGLGGGRQPDGAITVNASIDLERAAQQLRRGLNRIYDLSFVRDLRTLIMEKQKINLADPRLQISRWSSVYELDRLFTAGANGFKDREDYYRSCSTKNHVQRIQIPTYVLTAADDPFVRVQDYREASWSPAVSLHIEKRGGHLGYLSKISREGGLQRWLERYLEKAIHELIRSTSLPNRAKGSGQTPALAEER